MKRGPVTKRLPKFAHFDQFIQPTASKLKNIPELNSGGHRPPKMALKNSFGSWPIITFKNTAQPSICFKPSKKMILPAKTSLLNKALKKAASQKPSTIAVSNSCSTFPRGYSGMSLVRSDRRADRIKLFYFHACQ